jgi:uncharacterized protein with FMN-binding domain
MNRKKLLALLCVPVLLMALAGYVAAMSPGALPISTATFSPGTFTVSYGEAGTPPWRQGPLVLSVTFSENRITDIDVVEHGESLHAAGWYFRAYPAVPDQILVRQSTQDIDAFTGATVTRNAFVNAVNKAIVQAGANPEDLEPQFIDAPLDGDRFVPGFHIITVPARTMDIYGQPLTADTPYYMVMLYSAEEDMTLRVSFGRNEFHLYEGGFFGLGMWTAGGHGEPILTNPAEVGEGTWGDWWFSQIVQHQVNDYQSTRNIDISRGATRSAAGIIWGVEQAIIAAGGDPAGLEPRQVPPVKIQRNPATPDAPFFVPGHYTATARGFNGDITLTVTLDRNTIRRITVDEHRETTAYWNRVWPRLRDAIYEAQNIDEVDAVTGATASSNAIINAVREAIRMADPGDRQSR